MNSKTILKTLAMAMLMPAMLLTTACSSEDDLVNNTANTENTINKGYALPVTVNVTRGGDATTRATYNESTKKLEFSDGDKLFVYGSATAAGSFAGTLTWQSGGKFSGTIYTESPYEDTADALFTAANEVTATLLPNGYDANGSNSFLSIDNKNTTEAYDDRLTVAYSKAFVASETAKATGVEQLSLERTSTYSSGFALAPLNAILNFTISGLEAGAKDVSLQLSGFDNTVTGSVTPNASGVATFAIGVSGGSKIKDMDNNLTVGSSNLTLPGGTALAAGKIYNISRSAASVPTGALSGEFSVSGTKKVYFSKGNLQATTANLGSTWTWAFAANQWDYIGGRSNGGSEPQTGNNFINGNGTVSANGTVDLFGWSTSATTYGMNNSTSPLDYSGDFVDWGATIGTGWRTLTSDEWTYVFSTRTTGGTVFGTAPARYAHATINTDGTGVNGMILFPDGVDIASTEVTTAGTVNGNSAWATKCTTAQWSALAAKGCVFLPAAGFRYNGGTSVDLAGSYGPYWSSSPNDLGATEVGFTSGNLYLAYYDTRNHGNSVRLVRDVE